MGIIIDMPAKLIIGRPGKSRLVFAFLHLAIQYVIITDPQRCIKAKPFSAPVVERYIDGRTIGMTTKTYINAFYDIGCIFNNDPATVIFYLYLISTLGISF